MFRNLENECIIRFRLDAVSPISIRSGENLELDPTLPDNRFIRSFHDGDYCVVIPGSSIKGVFRSRAEKLLPECCSVFRNDCFQRTRDIRNDIQQKYRGNCPACRIFGSMSLKSRIEFKDSFPAKDMEVKLATRHNVGIDRVTGAAKRGALFEPEVLESGSFEVEIILRNFFLWQLKVILQIFADINEGYVTFGGVSSRGFGRMSAYVTDFRVREYGNCEADVFYREKKYTYEDMLEKVKNIRLNKTELERVDLENEHIL